MPTLTGRSLATALGTVSLAVAMLAAEEMGMLAHLRPQQHECELNGKAVEVVGDHVRFRAAPTLDAANILDELPQGSSVHVCKSLNEKFTYAGRSGCWYRVRIDDTEGYVFGGYLDGYSTRTQIGSTLYGRVRTTPGSTLALRAAASVNSRALKRMPSGARVLLGTIFGRPETIGGRRGQWRRAVYEGVEGYLFDGYVDVE